MKPPEVSPTSRKKGRVITVQYPERLYRERGFALYVTLCAVTFVVLMFSHLPWLYDWFNVEESKLDPLWSVGR
jgi:hypothetical protein